MLICVGMMHGDGPGTSGALVLCGGAWPSVAHAFCIS